MKKLLFFFLMAVPAMGQVTVAFVTPAYGFNVVTGSTRQIYANVQLNGAQCIPGSGVTCNVTWTATTAGGATVTFTNPLNSAVASIVNTIPTVQANFGGTDCPTVGAITGAMGSYALSCASTVTITATSGNWDIIAASFSSGSLQNCETVILPKNNVLIPYVQIKSNAGNG